MTHAVATVVPVQCALDTLPATRALLLRYGLRTRLVATGASIPGSYWGAPEAGLIGNRLYLSAATPLHSLLHEACHYVCMSAQRRSGVHTNAGGDYDEENGVCYLQIVLAGLLARDGRARLCADMDTWGYTFRLGSALAWFERDAQDARQWLRAHALLDAADQPTWKLRV